VPLPTATTRSPALQAPWSVAAGTSAVLSQRSGGARRSPRPPIGATHLEDAADRVAELVDGRDRERHRTSRHATPS
jgi:hypothetical protein